MLAALAAGAIGLGACGVGATGTPSAGEGGRVSVVAAENFYGNIAQQIGGTHVNVTSVLSDPNADPHLFQANTTTAAEVAEAEVVIENGVHYDDWMDRMIAASPNPARRVVRMADVLGVSGADANPHLWYDVPRLPQIASAIADALSAADPAHEASYRAGAAAFVASLEPLDDAVAGIKSKYGGTKVAYTEPVPGYLLEAAGLINETPEGFSKAIEEGTDPTPQSVAETNALLTGKQVRVLLYNAQAASPTTDQLRQLAGENGIPVVPVTETLPSGTSFQAWQLGQVQALEAALRG
ncbi:MAG: metal ABC transporter solute-binding protein, Zn/Mn family [Acidimicrobiales bacterium]